MKNVKYVCVISIMTGVAMLSISPAFAMEEKGKWVEREGFSQRVRVYEEAGAPGPLQRDTGNLTPEERKKDPVRKNGSSYGYRAPYYYKVKHYPFSYYDFY